MLLLAQAVHLNDSQWVGNREVEANVNHTLQAKHLLFADARSLKVTHQFFFPQRESLCLRGGLLAARKWI